MIRKFLQNVDDRIGFSPLWRSLSDSLPADHISILDAPPFSLGRITLILVGLLGLSGVALTLFYEPTAERAAASLAFLHSERPLGWLIHNTHRWSALFLVVIVVLHALRIWLQLAYRYPRDLNWWIGLLLLVILLIMGGTGYILRWDVKAFALMNLVISNLSSVAILGPTLVTIILGGTELDVVPLHRGYALHVWFLPFVLFSLIVTHLLVSWRQGLAEKSLTWQTLKARLPMKQWMKLTPGLALLILVVAISAITPHETLTGPTDRSAFPHPDWLLMFYFIPFWFFQGSSRIVGALLIPIALIVFIAFTPKIVKEPVSKFLRLALAMFGILGVIWLFGQMSVMGYQVPTQGCNACHREEIIGGAPKELSEFELRDPDWLVRHLEEPLLSIFEPTGETEELP